jgi:GT2 family glycosyltransferase
LTARNDSSPTVPASLAVSIVTYHSDLKLLGETLQGLATAALRAREAGLLGTCMLRVADNGSDAAYADALRPLLKDFEATAADFSATLLTGHGNVGYGAANNLAQQGNDADCMLILNPDVRMDQDALRAGLEVLLTRPDVGLVTPSAVDANGAPVGLAKSYPSVLVLFLRGFAPKALRRAFAPLLAKYDIALNTFDDSLGQFFVASGCFMLMRSHIFKAVEGFDPGFFMYFEDFDLTVRARRFARVAYLPAMRIVHHGGGASRKGLRHVMWFVASAARFFNTHGWLWISPPSPMPSPSPGVRA